MQYFMINTLGDPGDEDLCILEKTPAEMGAAYSRLAWGRPALEEFPQATIKMKPDSGPKLSSLIGNTRSLLIVADPLKALLEGMCEAEHCEYQPLEILNARGRSHTKEYWIVNPLGTVDCLDPERSEIRYLDDEVAGVDEFVLSERKLEDARPLFRPLEDPNRYIVSGALNDAVTSLGATNWIVSTIEVS